MKSTNRQVFYVPGEYDLTDNGKLYLERYGKGTKGSGWYSFNSNGVHFIGLVNALVQVDGGMGTLGEEQLKWLSNYIKGLFNSTPILGFAPIPLLAVYSQCGWVIKDIQQTVTHL